MSRTPFPDVVILAGGLGTRLNPVPGDIPKCLRPVADRPFLEHLMAQLRRHGAKRVVLSLGHMHEAFTRHLERRAADGLSVEASVEPHPLGTGGGLRFALPRLDTPRVLVLNGDSYVDGPLDELVEANRRRAARISLLACRVPDASRFGRVQLDAEDHVTGFLEKGASGPGFINAGVYVLERAVIQAIPERRGVSLERDVFPAHAGPGFTAVKGDWPFIDIGTPESLRQAEAFFAGK